jgi:hypothetical protein
MLAYITCNFILTYGVHFHQRHKLSTCQCNKFVKFEYYIENLYLNTNFQKTYSYSNIYSNNSNTYSNFF